MTSGIDESLSFIPVRIAVLTVSDTRTEETDTSGALLAQKIEETGHTVADRKIVVDEVDAITKIVGEWIADPQVDVVISNGGTGVTGRDVTPEAFKALYDKEIEGFAVVFHQVSYESVGVSTLQSRATAGVAAGTFLFALPGSNGAVKDGWDKVIRWELDARHKPCNLVTLMPRLMER